MSTDPKLLSAILEAAPIAMVMIDREGEIALVNTETEKLFGYPRNELLGQPVEILVPDRFRAAHPGHRGSFFATPTARRMGIGRDLYARRKDNSEFPVEIGLNPVETGEGVFVLSAIADITERKQAEEKFRLVVESAPNAMVMVNQHGEIVLVNSETERCFGYPRADLLGQSIEMLVPTRFRENHPGYRHDYFNHLVTRSMGAGRDLFGLHKDGSEFPVEIGLNPIRTQEGTLVLSSIIDISERKQAEQALQDRSDELARSNAELEQFAYLASHDLQEPLRTVTSFVDVLQRDSHQMRSEKVGTSLRFISNAATRMSELITGLLEYSRVGREGQQVIVDCNTMVNAIQEDLSHIISESRATLNVEELPQLKGCEPELRMLVQNLIINAIKFRTKDTDPSIRIVARQEQRYWQISIHDNGIGIAPEHQNRIFDIFQRLHTKQEYEGTGIGLAHCRKIVHAHGGKIWVDSYVGKGSAFHFTLPC